MNIHEYTALLDAFLDGETTPEETAEDLHWFVRLIHCNGK